MPKFSLFGCEIDVTDDTKTATVRDPDGKSHTFHSERTTSAQVQAQRFAKLFKKTRGEAERVKSEKAAANPAPEAKAEPKPQPKPAAKEPPKKKLDK